MKKQDTLEAGDHCRVVQSGGGLGETLWVVTWSSPNSSRCAIREAGKPLHAEQVFDKSLLAKVARP